MKKGFLKNGIFIFLVIALAAALIVLKPIRRGLDLEGGVYVGLKAVPTENIKINDDAMSRLIEVLDRRLNGMLAVGEPVIQRNGFDRVIVEIPGIKDAEEAIKKIGKTALLEFRIKNEDKTYGPVLLTGKSLKNASQSYDQYGSPAVSFELDNEGSLIFEEITGANIGKQLAIMLDGEEQTAPVINTKIPGGKGVITGRFSIDEAKGLASLLQAGALPVKVEMLEIRTIGASLGQESIEKSKKAAIVAIALVGIFMLFIYRMPGLIANIALIIFGIITFGAMSFIDATLTLPGIAGFILSLGMAVDANVIIFERIKEELRMGNSILAAVDGGFKKAFVAILDSNITTLIITGILYMLGTGPVKGFAVTLTVGILASMFTAITVTRFLLKFVVYKLEISNSNLFGVRGK